tara:strand:- start:532 stop:1266 length:735 start_codon:yes stop_codon:yes gene_type:complete
MLNWVNIPLQKAEVMQGLQQALQHTFIDNLRSRHPNVALDSKLRGYVGEIAFRKWLKQNGISNFSCNHADEASGMDVDFLFYKNGEELHLELKTSLIPDADETFETLAEKRDIKLIRRQNQSIEALKGDVHVQLFFKQLRLRKDEWLKSRTNISDYLVLERPPDGRAGSREAQVAEKIYREFAAYRYEKDAFLAAWIDKPTLIKQLAAKPQKRQKWKYGKREFWCCNLKREAKSISQLIDHLKD